MPRRVALTAVHCDTWEHPGRGGCPVGVRVAWLLLSSCVPLAAHAQDPPSDAEVDTAIDALRGGTTAQVGVRSLGALWERALAAGEWDESGPVPRAFAVRVTPGLSAFVEARAPRAPVVARSKRRVIPRPAPTATLEDR